jgi:aconitase A
MAEAIVRSIAVNAAKGQTRSQKMFTQMLSTVERERRNLHNEWLQTAIEYKVSWMERIKDAQRRGLPPPQPVPHPDHIEIDMNTGEVIIKGPFTPEEKVQWDQWAKRKREAVEAIEAMSKQLRIEQNEVIRQKIQEEIDFEQNILSILANTGVE